MYVSMLFQQTDGRFLQEDVMCSHFWLNCRHLFLGQLLGTQFTSFCCFYLHVADFIRCNQHMVHEFTSRAIAIFLTRHPNLRNSLLLVRHMFHTVCNIFCIFL